MIYGAVFQTCCRYPLTTYSSVKGGGSTGKERERDTPSVRIKLHYHVVSILQLKMYDDFLKVCVLVREKIRSTLSNNYVNSHSCSS